MDNRSTSTLPLADLRTRAEQWLQLFGTRPAGGLTASQQLYVFDLIRDLLEALREQTQEKATDFAWPQDVDGLLAMAAEWGIAKPGDMDASDVLIAKLAAALLLARQERDFQKKRADDRVAMYSRVSQELERAGERIAELEATLARLQSEWTVEDALRRVFELTGAESIEIHSGDREPGNYITRESLAVLTEEQP